MWKQLFTAAASAASIISLAFVSFIPMIGRIFLVVIGVFCLCFLTYDSIKNNRINETVCRSDEEIKQVMRQLIQTDGQTCIMSRNLTWVDDELEKEIYKKKDDLLIFVSRKSELTERLKAHEVRVKYYGKTGFVPKTRFTVLRYTRNNPQVAIANTQDTVRRGAALTHTIYETSDEGSRHDRWINSLALDMIRLCESVSDDNG